jgi:hypothetical protein
MKVHYKMWWSWRRKSVWAKLGSSQSRSKQMNSGRTGQPSSMSSMKVQYESWESCQKKCLNPDCGAHRAALKVKQCHACEYQLHQLHFQIVGYYIGWRPSKRQTEGQKLASGGQNL